MRGLAQPVGRPRVPGGRLPKYIELGGDRWATYIYVADDSMAVSAAVTPIRIVCANALAAALAGAVST